MSLPVAFLTCSFCSGVNAIWTLAWTPSLTMPAGNGRKGLPLGIQLIGPRFRDEALLDAAAWVEARLH